MENIGRKVLITSIGFSPRPVGEFADIVEDEAKMGCDLILLPETCTGNEPIETLAGESVGSMAKIAAKYRTYIVLPIYRSTETEARLNSSILIGRGGEVCGVYDKVYPFWSEFELVPQVAVGQSAPVFETDFGKVGLAICFDANFPELFRRLSLGGAEVILWSSAYSAGTSLQAHAINHNFTVVTSTLCPDCTVYDITGRETHYQSTPGGVNISRVALDLDRCVFHHDYNLDKRARLLKDYEGKIESDAYFGRESWFTLRATAPGVSAKKAAAEYGMEELAAYKNRSLAQIDEMRGFRIGR